MKPVAIVMPSALILDYARCTRAAQLTAGVETTLIVSPDPDASGFSRTVNRGLEQVPAGHDVLVLNDDVAGFRQGWLAKLQEAMYSRPDIGVIGPSGNCATLPISRWTPDMTGMESVEHFPFFCTLIRRECLDAVGKLDERFIHYSSDYWFCDVARVKGWLVVWCKDVQVVHETHGSKQRQAWAGHDLSLYGLRVRRLRQEGLWAPVRPLS